MKRFVATVALTLMFLCVAFGASAEAQSVVVSQKEDKTVEVTVTGDTTTSWECPVLRAGESMNEKGSLILENDTDTERTLRLTMAELPFEDSAALAYLNHVILTVTDGDTILYSGPYARINDGELDLSCTLKAGETHEYGIHLRAEYDTPAFEGWGDTAILWNFAAVTETKIENAGEKVNDAFGDPALRDMLIAVVAAGLLIGGVFLYDYYKKKKA